MGGRGKDTKGPPKEGGYSTITTQRASWGFARNSASCGPPQKENKPNKPAFERCDIRCELKINKLKIKG